MSLPKENNQYISHYSDAHFWAKLGQSAANAGKALLENALVLYFCLIDPDTPLGAKTVIISALGYFIFPLDLVPDILPIGYSDDFATLCTALAIVAIHIKPQHRAKARETLGTWFPPATH